MAVKIRLTRGGSKNRPYYTIIAADSRSPRDGAFLEKLGSYNPTLPKDSADRFQFKKDRVQYWLDKGAQSSELVTRYLVKAGILKESKKVIALRDKAKIRQQAVKAEAAKKAADEAKAAEAAANPPAAATPEAAA
jgi:small subunit ribosomal protein S16